MEQEARRVPRHVIRPRLDDDELLFHEVKKVDRGDLRKGVPPESKSPVLACYGCGHFITHNFVGRRPVTDVTKKVLYIELVYACSCGKQRVFGTESQ